MTKTMTPIDRRIYGGRTHQTALYIRRTEITGEGQSRELKMVPEERLPLPTELAPGEVLVMVYMCQICDTDVELGTHAGHGAPTKGFDPEVDDEHTDSVPWVLNGHEAGGVVIAKAADVSRVDVGDWASLKVREGNKSRRCPMCQADISNRCHHWQYAPADMEEHGIFRAPGWFCLYSTLDEKQVIKIPDGMPAEYASMGEPLSIGANAFMTALDRWYTDPGFLEETTDGPPAIAVIGAGGLASIDAPIFSEWPENIDEAIRQGHLPESYLSRPFAEWRREKAGMAPKKPAKAEVFYYARTPKRPGLTKAEVVEKLGIQYVSFEDIKLPYIEVVTPAEGGKPERVDKVYNLTPLMENPQGVHPTRKRFDLVVEMCTNPRQIARMMLPPSDPGEMDDFFAAAQKSDDARCEGRYVMPPSTPEEREAFMKTPRWGCGGLMAPGTKLVVTSITGADEVYPNLPVAKFCWAGTLNNIDIAGVVNYDEFHTLVGLLSLDMVSKKPGLQDWPRSVQEKIVKNVEDLRGEGMYQLKRSHSGRVAVVMNSMDEIEKALSAARGES